jgi:hypothetical protein
VARKELQDQHALIEGALAAAPAEVLRHALDGTVGDTQAFCWGALRQFERRGADQPGTMPRDFGLRHVDLHVLLIVACETVSHVEVLERLLASLGVPRHFPPGPELRSRLREARNLLAEHRDERVLYWRLTARHTPHVEATFRRLGVELPNGTIDSEVLGYFAPEGATAGEVEEGLSSVGILGGLLSQRQLHAELIELEHELGELAARTQGEGAPPTLEK